MVYAALLLVAVGISLYFLLSPSEESEPPSVPPAVSTSPPASSSPNDRVGTAPAGIAPAAGDPRENDDPASSPLASPSFPEGSTPSAERSTSVLPSSAALGGELNLVVRGLDSSWIRIATDERPAEDIWLRPAEQISLSAQTQFGISTGQANAVRVYLNGREVQLPLSPGRVLENFPLNAETLTPP